MRATGSPRANRGNWATWRKFRLVAVAVDDGLLAVSTVLCLVRRVLRVGHRRLRRRLRRSLPRGPGGPPPRRVAPDPGARKAGAGRCKPVGEDGGGGGLRAGVRLGPLQRRLGKLVHPGDRPLVAPQQHPHHVERNSFARVVLCRPDRNDHPGPDRPDGLGDEALNVGYTLGRDRGDVDEPDRAPGAVVPGQHEGVGILRVRAGVELDEGPIPAEPRHLAGKLVAVGNGGEPLGEAAGLPAIHSQLHRGLRDLRVPLVRARSAPAT
ncbi:hypothetical protein T492DRAFT_987055 [Pavlovales sp. CCMP2436]|nr:hypothetical protein T492DRAFT_987055 [Pavlovales sp. CCMP2436]|mmetsp:Transcript_10230/g.25756  ORF Transcript_10230/g.25756 Transcript_10230/m.25756 type:complete len:266 (+) Transcript_10230:201-998(+)